MNRIFITFSYCSIPAQNTYRSLKKYKTVVIIKQYISVFLILLLCNFSYLILDINLYWFYKFQAFRPDRVIAAGHIFVSAVLGEGFTASAERELDLGTIVETELSANVPALLCSVPGFDASSRVDDLAAEKGKQIASIAIGSAEGFNQASNVINVAVRSGK